MIRVKELTRQQYAAGQSRTALLIGIEAAEAALEAGEEGREAASAVTALLTNILATREQTAPIAARSATERTAQVCNESTVLTLTGDNTFDVWRTGSSRRTTRHNLPGASLDGVGLDRECSRALIPNLDFNVEVRSLSSGRTIALLHGHEAPITAATFSPDGTTIVTASKDGTARIWDAASGRMRHLLSGHDWHVTGAAFSPDGRRVLTAASDMTARIWEAATGREMLRLNHQGVVTSAVFSTDGRRIITTSWDGFVRLWDATTGQTLHTLGQPGGLRSAEASRDGRLAATSASDGGLTMWDAETGRALRTLAAIDVKHMVFTPDSRRLVVLSWNNGLEIYDVATGAMTARPAGSDQKVIAVSLAQGGRAVIGITEAGTRLTWPLIDDASEAMAQAKAIAPPCLSHDERAILGLEGDPPAWCAKIRPRDAALPPTAGAGER